MPRALVAVAVAGLLTIAPVAAAQGPAPTTAQTAAPWPPLTLTPPNIERADPALARLRDLLRDAIRERRLDAVQALMAPTIRDQDADTPVDHEGTQPLLTLDVWEHAYYIDYRNERPRFAESVLGNIVNWEFVGQNLDGEGISRADQEGA